MNQFRLLYLFTFLSILTLPLSAQNYYLNENFNSGALPSGWTNTAVTGSQAWSFGIDGSNGGSANISAGIQNIDGTNFAYFDDDVLSGSSVNNYARLTTPTFDNAANSITYLEFDYNFKDYSGIPDSFYVEVFDGSTWIKVLTRITDDCGHYSQPTCGNGFPHANIDISSYKNSNCQVRFSYFDGNDWGWYAGLDNVQIYSPFPNDVQVTEIVGPASSCGLSTTESIQVKIKNIGTLAASNFTVSYQLNGGTAVNETVNGTIAPNDSLTYTFAATADLSAVSTYDIKAYTTLNGDGNLINDSTSTTVINKQMFVPTYTNDFETANTNWEIGGTNSSWELGVPNNSNISIAASGQQAYVTNLDGIYNSNETSYLVSPCFDFSSSIGDPIITFSLQYLTEAAFDQLWMEYSLNGGQNWTKLAASANATNWYNNTTNQVWEGSSNGWKSVENILTGLAGEPRVQLRLVFNTDGGGLNEGIGFDLFSVRDPQPIDLSLNALLYPVNSAVSICGYGANENIIVELENKGTNPITNFDVSYQVNNGSIITETVTNTISPNNKLSYIFNTNYNFSAQTTFSIRLWASAPGDSYAVNDTLNNLSITNTQTATALNLPIEEDFETSIAGTNFSNTNDTLISNWSRSGNVDWRVTNTSANLSANTGPDQDHTPNGSNFLYLETSSASNYIEGYLTSPCFNLSLHGTDVSYWYHKYGSEMGDLFFEINVGNGWEILDSVIGETHYSRTDLFLNRSFKVPSKHDGKKAKLRFRGVKGTGFMSDMAIDDISITARAEFDLSLNSVKSPAENCELSNNNAITILLLNEGKKQIQSDSAFLYYQVNSGLVIKDTLDVNLNSDSTTVFTFSQTTDLSAVDSLYEIKIWGEFTPDTVTSNDTLLRPLKMYQADLFEDFESFPLDKEISKEGFYWKTQNGTSDSMTWIIGSTPHNTSTGPYKDHTVGIANGGGKFAYKATGVSYEVSLISPCVALNALNSAELRFWYHKYGSTMDDLYIDIEDYTNDTIYKKVDSIIGQTQFSGADPWLERTVDLSQFNGSVIKVHFSSLNDFTNFNIIALDDISIIDSTLITNIKSNDFESINLTLYPNPSTGKYYIKSSKSIAGYEYQILDLHGREVKSSVIKPHQNSFDLSDNAEGIYFLVIPEIQVKEKLIKY